MKPEYKNVSFSMTIILFTFALCCLLFPSPKAESTVVLPYTPTAGTSIKASEMKANFDACVNGINTLETALTNGDVYTTGATTTLTIATTTWAIPMSGATDQLSFASGSVITYDALVIGKLSASAAAGIFRVTGSLESYDNTLKQLGATVTKLDGNLTEKWGISPSVTGNVFKLLASGTSGIQFRIVQFFYSQI